MDDSWHNIVSSMHLGRGHNILTSDRTYPTVYVDYLAFRGAGATATGTCAQTLAASVLTLPANAPAASLVYPLDRSNALPAGLVSYLNGAGGFPAQLAGNQLQTCAALPGAVPAAGTISSVVIAVTSLGAVTSTIATTIPPPTTFTTTISQTIVSSRTVAATQAVSLSTIGQLQTSVTGPALLISGSVTTSLTQPLAVSLAGGSTTTLGPRTTSAIDLTNVLSSISSSIKVLSGTYTNSTTTPTTARLPPTGATTTSAVPYTGLAVANTPVLVNSGAGILAGLAAIFCL